MKIPDQPKPNTTEIWTTGKPGHPIENILTMIMFIVIFGFLGACFFVLIRAFVSLL